MANAIILQDFQLGKGPIAALSGDLSDRMLTGMGGSNTRGSAKQIIPPGVACPTAKTLLSESGVVREFPVGACVIDGLRKLLRQDLRDLIDRNVVLGR